MMIRLVTIIVYIVKYTRNGWYRSDRTNQSRKIGT